MLGFGRRRRTLAHQLGACQVRARSAFARSGLVIAGNPARLAELRVDDHVPSGVRVSELVGLSLEEMDRELSAYSGSGLLVVDARCLSGDAARAFERLFLHLGKGDVWIALRSQRVPEGKRERLVDLAGRFEAHGPRDSDAVAGAPAVGGQCRGRGGHGPVREEPSASTQGARRRCRRPANAREPGLRVSELASRAAGTITRATMTDVGASPGRRCREARLPGVPGPAVRRPGGAARGLGRRPRAVGPAGLLPLAPHRTPGRQLAARRGRAARSTAVGVDAAGSTSRAPTTSSATTIPGTSAT